MTIPTVTLDTQRAPEFMPLWARRILYVLALIATVVAPAVALYVPDLVIPVLSAAGILNAAATGTALANPSR